MRPRRRHVYFDEAYLPMLRSAGLGDYESVMSSRAGETLTKPGLGARRRTRLDLTTPDGAALTIYLKRYARCRLARTEWNAVLGVRDAGVPTMAPVATGSGPAGGFVMVTCVPGDALERCMDGLLARRGDDRRAMVGLATGLGRLIGELHRAGMAHRDFYTSHVFCHELEGGFDLYLIDLARVFRPRWRQWRWWAKDLAQLKSSLPAAWSEAYWPTILAAYERTCLRRLPQWAAAVIESRVRALRRERTKASSARKG